MHSVEENDAKLHHHLDQEKIVVFVVGPQLYWMKPCLWSFKFFLWPNKVITVYYFVRFELYLVPFYPINVSISVDIEQFYQLLIVCSSSLRMLMLFKKKCKLELFINLVFVSFNGILAFHDFKVVVKFQTMFTDEFLTGRIALQEPLTIYIIHPHF